MENCFVTLADGRRAVHISLEARVQVAKDYAALLKLPDTLDRPAERDVSVLRAHAIAGAMRQCRPPEKGPARAAWWDCVRHLASIVCSKEGMSIAAFFFACGDTD